MTTRILHPCATAALVVVALTAVVPRGVAAQSLTAPDPDTALMRPAEIQRLFDAYFVMEAQQTLGLSDAQYPTFLTRLRTLQETRRRHLQAASLHPHRS